MKTEEMEPMRKTPLYAAHVGLGAKIAPFGGWLMPIQYEGILAEQNHTREAVTVFDICHMGEFQLEADPVESGFDRIVTQRIVSMPEGSCRYGFMLNAEGGIIDDLIVYRLKKNAWMIVVNAATIAGDEAHIKKHISGSARFENVSASLGKLDVQGPRSRDVIRDIFGSVVDSLTYYTFTECLLWGQKCIVSRTGYTGELGYEVYIGSDYVAQLWDVLLKDSRVKPAGLGSRDILRLEMCYPLYGQDLDTLHSPLAAGLKRFVDFNKDFIGKQALLNEQKNGLKETLVCFKADSRRSPRHGFGIYVKDTRIGTVTSGTFSPALGVGIGMGYVSVIPEQGAGVVVKEGNTEIPVTIVKKPFYNNKEMLR